MNSPRIPSMHIHFVRGNLTYGPVVLNRKKSCNNLLRIALSGALSADNPIEFLCRQGVRPRTEQAPGFRINAKSVSLEPADALQGDAFHQMMEAILLYATRRGQIEDRMVIETPPLCLPSLGRSVVIERRRDEGFHFDLPDRPEEMTLLAECLALPRLLGRIDFGFQVAPYPDERIYLDHDALLAPLQIDLAKPLAPAMRPGRAGKVEWRAAFANSVTALVERTPPWAPLRVELEMNNALRLDPPEQVNARGRYSYLPWGTLPHFDVNLGIVMNRESTSVMVDHAVFGATRPGFEPEKVHSAWENPGFGENFVSTTYREWLDEYQRRFPANLSA